VIRNLEILGEASNNIQKHYPEFATRHPELPLAFAYEMRNAVAYVYFKVGRRFTPTFLYCRLGAECHCKYSEVQGV
jgi:uncharacterized protein with HEPN domain